MLFNQNIGVYYSADLNILNRINEDSSKYCLSLF